MADAKSCRWPTDEFMIATGMKEEFDRFIENVGLTDFLADKCVQYYNLTRTFTNGFHFQAHNSRVLFKLYDASFNMTLEEFSVACKLPLWGLLKKPSTVDYNMFLESLWVGEDRGVTQARIKSIQFPSIRYFALFNGKCVVEKQECSTLCSPDLSLIHTAVTGEKHFNLGAIVARRLHSNSSNGELYGGIYASRVAAQLGVSPQHNDPILPDRYLDYEAMRYHEFFVNRARGYEYN